MIDFHSHSLLSDGVLLPCELARRAEEKGITCIAITDHVDYASAGCVAEKISKTAEYLKNHVKIKIIPGVEITHMPPALIEKAVREARVSGARIVLVHGETIVEPVARGTNRAAVESGIDVLAHPGIIDPETAAAAAGNGVFLEISSRKGHSLTNGLVAKAALAAGAAISFGSDSHGPGDIPAEGFAGKVLAGAGLSDDEAGKVFLNMEKWVEENGIFS